MKPAPGPWKFILDCGIRKIMDSDNELVCRVDNDITADANAHLIAAAPELLEFAKRAKDTTDCSTLYDDLVEFFDRFEIPEPEEDDR